MDDRQVKIYVEGEIDKIIVTYILQASKLFEKIEVISCIGKAGVAEKIKNLQDSKSFKYIALIDSDQLSVQDSREEAYVQLGRPHIDVFCAVPEIEAWLFADDMKASGMFDDTKRKNFIARLPLPEMIVYPRLVARNIFPRTNPSESYDFLRHIDIERAAARSPSLRTFLSGVRKALDLPGNVEEKALATTIGRDVISTLLRELPADTVVWRTIDGNSHTAQQLAKAIGEGSNEGRQFSTELLRIARDLIVRKAAR
jgi:hypothetical protein